MPLLLLGAAFACRGTREPRETLQPSDPRAQAERFIAAVNARDVDALLQLSADTLLFREQQWRTASDGVGFTLGPPLDTVVAGTEARRRFFTDLAGRVHVRQPTAVEHPPSKSALFARELASADPRWSALTLVVFLRGEGDVEHTAMTGMNPRTRKVAAFYVN
ncbi:hypothetical protein [Gemmatirosa kalamazoonensis]|uniref:hypothetical protein n=1 Tax=Gemmatirosa kalamazoonensis TaxID=861299 RepID=UPI00046CE33F|nr:hypothetical protein [Gemmatirosa kalamazoonensis]